MRRPLATSAMPKNSQSALLRCPTFPCSGRGPMGNGGSSFRARSVMPPAWKPMPSVGHPTIVGCTPAKWL